MFAKNIRGYRLTSKNILLWSLLILLLVLSVASLLKTTYTEEHSVHTNSESCNIRSDRKKSIYFKTNHSDITSFNYRFFFDAFYSWYFIMFYGKLVRRTFLFLYFLRHALNIRNQTRLSSRLSIPMFIGTPCT